MAYYHCSPTPGLKILEPRKPETFDKPANVYMTTSLSMALLYGVRNFEYTYGYTREGRIYYEEYFPDALEVLYRGRRASLYLCAPEEVTATRIPNEALSSTPVPVISETVIEDVYEAILEQEQLGALAIRRYQALSAKDLEWIRQAEADTIRKHNLLHTGGPMAEYMKRHYPESWAMAKAEL